ncbi:unnamed protein product [Orchesella dallaii]|uniref:C2H2-type domain-containing protein n=1 Tax=Orchesella dallaii TaxID=48710 RepID=A0ABP1RU44_9HEXA
MSSEFFIRNCLFCAVPCSPTVITENGEIKRVRKVKREGFCGGGDDDAELPSYAFSSLPLLEEEENPLLGNQLKLEGQLHPEFWVEVCGPCGEAVGDYYQTLRLISKLKEKLATISTQLKRRIWDSKDTSLGGGGGDDFSRKNDNDDSNHKDTLNFIWRDIRDQALGRECMSGMLLSSFDEDPSPLVSPFEDNSLWDDSSSMPVADVKMEMQEDFIDESSNSSPRRPPSVSNSSESEDTDEDYIPEWPESSKKVKHRKPRSTATSSKSRIRPLPAIQRIRRKQPNGMSTTTETWYKCSHCGFETSSDPKSKEHVQLHSSASPYGIPLVSCRICRWVLPSDEFKYHIDNYHTTLPHTKGVVISRKSSTYFNCELCPYKCRTRESMRSHARLHKPGPGSVTCSYCGWPGTVATVRSHKFTYHPKEYQNELNDNDVEEELPFKTLKLGKRKKVS